MDSTAYKYLIEKLQSETAASTEFLPIHFAKSPVNTEPDAFRSLEFFLKNITGQEKPVQIVIPNLLLYEGSFFRDLFLSAHRALLEVLSGHNASSHVFRTNGIQLARFLTFCTRDERPLFVVVPDPPNCAMLCFLTEGMMHAGWCPNAAEGQAKRAAHSYFIALKKSLHHAKPGDIASVLGYLWSAWLLAQKTEGIRTEGRQPSLNAEETFSWNLETGPKTYCAKKSAAPDLFYLLSKCTLSFPHPFTRLMNDGRLGLSLWVNNEPVRPVSLADFIEIKRQKISGNRFVCNCATDSIPDISWSIVVLVYENTLYRIDILKLPEGKENVLVDPEMRLECGTHPELQKKNYFISKGLENTVVRFLDSPFGFAFDRHEEPGISVFHAPGSLTRGTLKLITAWASGKGISAINETRLLGIYE